MSQITSLALILLGVVLIAHLALILNVLVPSVAIWEPGSEFFDQDMAFGAESNPTGSPIGGGEGYSGIITPMDPRIRYTIATQDELLTALESAEGGDIIYIDANAEINLTETSAVIIPAGVTLASNRGVKDTAGTAVYSFVIPEPGEYSIWGLAYAADEDNNSFWIQMDAGECREWDLESAQDWYWNKEGIHNLSAGHHTLTVKWREDGTKLDGILITDDPGYIPGSVMERQVEGWYLWMEAESGTLSPPMKVEWNSTASGGAEIMVPEGAGLGEPPISPGAKISLATGSWHSVALIAGGEDVRITGLRIEGPDRSVEEVERPTFGICSDHQNLEVDNCELSGWSGAAIRIQGTGNRSDMKTGGYVHHNYVHHNQASGLGYGVEVGQDGVCLIEANKFDYCRHAIAGTGDVNNGYEVCYNVFGPNFPRSNNAHVVDMHGVSTSSGNVAGNRLDIHHNTFEANSTTHYCIAVRGIPRTGAYIDHNWIQYSGAPIGRTGVTSGQVNTRMFIGQNKGPSGEILTTLQQRIISTDLS